MRILDKFPRFKHGELKGWRCLFEGCDKKAICRGLCERHYSRAKKGNMNPKRKVDFGNDDERFVAKFKQLSSVKCWIWEGGTRPNGKGDLYGRLHLSSGKSVGAHRFSYEKYIGRIPDGRYVCHACDTPLCVNPNHLFVGTHQDNMKDMVKKGRAYKAMGENWRVSKLKNKDVNLIKKSKLSRKKLAKKFNVSEACIGRILRGETYNV